METLSVPREWVERVRDVLYELAHQEGDRGAEANALGTYIPGFLQPEPAPPSTEQPKNNVMVNIRGSRFRCPCTCSVFNQPKPISEPNIYRCNACGNEFEAA